MTAPDDLMALAEPRIDVSGNSNYAPCEYGLHLCGITPDGQQFYTAANVATTSEVTARRLFADAKAVAECAEDEADFCCDLMIGGDHCEDFWTNRQLARLIASRARASQSGVA